MTLPELYQIMGSVVMESLGMADEEQLEILERGVEVWNSWRKNNPGVRVDLSNANLSNTNLNGVDLRNSDLSDVNFDKANLIKANFIEAKLTRVSFRVANLFKAELINANLKKVDFSKAYLKGTDFSGAILSGAILIGAILSRVLGLNTNFSNSNLTGACIKDWNINSNTNFDHVICEHIYLNYEHQGSTTEYKNNTVIYTDRRPSDPSKTFEPGDFARLVQKAQETVDLIFREGIDWQAFSTSFQGLQIECESEVNIQAIERKPDGSFVVRVEVPQDANKGEIEHSFQAKYEAELKRLGGVYRAELNAKDREIEIYKRENTNLWELAKLGANRPIHVETHQNNRNTTISDNEIQGTAYTEELKGSSYTERDTQINPPTDN